MSNIRSRAAYFGEDVLWVSHSQYNCLIKIKRDNWSVLSAVSFVGEEILQKDLHKGVCEYNGALFFYPSVGRGISIINMETDEQMFVDLAEKLNENKVGFSTAIVQGGKMLLLPKKVSRNPVLFDMESLEVQEIHLWKQKIDLCSEEIKNTNFTRVACVDGEYWAPFNGTNSVMCFDFEMKNIQIIEIDIGGREFHTIMFDGEKVWFTFLLDNVIAEYDRDKGELIYYGIDGKQYCGCDRLFIFCLSCENKIVAIPRNYGTIQIFDEEKNDFTTLSDFPIGYILPEKEELMFYFSYYIQNHTIWLFPDGGNMVLEINVLERSIKGHSLQREEIVENEYYNTVVLAQKVLKSCNKNGFILEKNIEGSRLQEYLTFLVNGGIDAYQTVVEVEKENSVHCGKRVHDILKKRMS